MILIYVITWECSKQAKLSWNETEHGNASTQAIELCQYWKGHNKVISISCLSKIMQWTALKGMEISPRRFEFNWRHTQWPCRVPTVNNPKNMLFQFNFVIEIEANSLKHFFIVSSLVSSMILKRGSYIKINVHQVTSFSRRRLLSWCWDKKFNTIIHWGKRE